MAQSADLLKELLVDAKLVAAYAMRTGRLLDGALIRAIVAVEASPKRQWSDPATIDLQIALNAAIRLIAPTTLIDLRFADPFVAPGKTVSKKPAPRFNYYFVAFSLVMMLAAAWYTLQYNTGAAATTELEAISNEHVREEVGSIVRKILAAEPKIDAILGKGSVIEDGEPYFLLVEQLRVFDSRVKKYSNIASNFLVNSDFPILALYYRIAPPIGDIWNRFFPGPQANVPYGGCDTVAPLTQTPTFNQLLFNSIAAKVYGSQAGGLPQPSPVLTAFEKMYAQYYQSTLRVLCVAQVETNPFTIPPIEELAVRSRNRINILSLWFLPAIYGGLGATIYYMRRILDPTLVDPSTDRILHRIALGAFAGIIIAWFWAPSNRIYSDFADVGLNLFGAAFVIGFSVEIFFAFLDRVVFLIVEWIKQLGARPPPATTTTT